MPARKRQIEQVGSNRISLSGKRLRLIAESNPNYVPFTYDNITLEIPTNYLLSLNLKDNEVLMVSIVPGSGKEVTLAVRAAGKVLTNIPNSRLTWKQEHKTRTIDKTGVYKPPGSAKQKSSGQKKPRASSCNYRCHYVSSDFDRLLCLPQKRKETLR